MSKSSAETPLMQQHNAIKQKYPDAILLFRVGDFYETFGQDAVTASGILGITLTKRNNGSASASELAGFPHHSLDSYLHKLVKAGYRVAICDQLEDPKLAKGIVKRGVTELVTPGIATHDKLLEHHTNNFLAGIHFTDSQHGIAFLDISTGEFFIAEGDHDHIDNLLQTLQPAEVIFQRSHQKLFKERFGRQYHTYGLENWIFDDTYAQENLLKQFGTHSLKGFGVESLNAGIIAAGAVLHYLKDTEHPHLGHITTLQRLNRSEHLWMDRFTIRNLELLPGTDDNRYSLLQTLDNTVSPMGARLLKRWIILPLVDPERINERLDLVTYMVQETTFRQQIQQHIKACGDVERLVSKIPSRKIGPRELLQLADSLMKTGLIKESSLHSGQAYLKKLAEILDPCPTISQLIISRINENPPAVAFKGGMIADGVDEELDKLRLIAAGGKRYLTQLQQKEAERTGIASLKIGFNNVFGYYLEVSNAQKSKVPEDWIRKQTLTNGERYITPELKTYEEQITGAEERILQMETTIYDQLLQELLEFIPTFLSNAQVLAILDVICCFASNAWHFRYRRPELHMGTELDLKGSRHPVIERHLQPGEEYVSNDIFLDSSGQQIIILTGPNMSGKSALLRQTALVTLMAHMGSFVPADSARIPLTDKIFTRVGASDNLSGGESTFMVEMNETASIINNISSRSLILLDEIGRGTSTYDGISIAWSIVEYLHDSIFKPKTLFATHYHELNELENRLGGVKNHHITNRESGNRIIFLRKLAPGGSTHSFGIHVARMAGMPPELIDRANAILKQLEQQHVKEDGAVSISSSATPKVQLSIFDSHSETFASIRELLDGLDIDRLTPVEALLKLSEVKSRLK
jgi:DNA mismatch repair protein MutS